MKPLRIVVLLFIGFMFVKANALSPDEDRDVSLDIGSTCMGIGLITPDKQIIRRSGMKIRTIRKLLVTSGILLCAVPIHSEGSETKNFLENGSQNCGDIIGSCITGSGG